MNAVPPIANANHPISDGSTRSRNNKRAESIIGIGVIPPMSAAFATLVRCLASKNSPVANPKLAPGEKV